MDEKKRIIEFDAAESVPVDGQMAIDSPQLGTKKITPTLLLKDINDLLGDVPLQTQAQILTGAINELNAKIFQASIKTQAEWEALPDTKFSDNIAYYIRDGESTVGNALWTKVGLHGLDTNAKNCSDAINELKGTLTYSAFTVSTSRSDFVIDYQKCYKVGGIAILSITGHATANISNQQIIDFPSGIRAKNGGGIIGVFGGTARWELTEFVYTYLSEGGVTTILNNGHYIHIYMPFIIK